MVSIFLDRIILGLDLVLHLVRLYSSIEHNTEKKLYRIAVDQNDDEGIKDYIGKFRFY